MIFHWADSWKIYEMILKYIISLYHLLSFSVCTGPFLACPCKRISNLSVGVSVLEAIQRQQQTRGRGVVFAHGWKDVEGATVRLEASWSTPHDHIRTIATEQSIKNWSMPRGRGKAAPRFHERRSTVQCPRKIGPPLSQCPKSCVTVWQYGLDLEISRDI